MHTSNYNNMCDRQYCVRPLALHMSMRTRVCDAVKARVFVGRNVTADTMNSRLRKK